MNTKSRMPVGMLLATLSVFTCAVCTAQTVTYQKRNLQQIDGFGASNAFFVGGDNLVGTGGNPPQDLADFYTTFSSTEQQQVMNALYSQTSGAGLSILRMRIDPAFEPSKGNYSYSTVDENATYANSAMGLGVAKIWATSWTPPAWMKSNGDNANGGMLNTANYPDYTTYLDSYYDRMVNTNHIPLETISIQNEPNLNTTYESCIWSGQNFHDFLAQSRFSKIPSNFLMLAENDGWSDDLASQTLQDSATASTIKVVGAHAYNVSRDGSDYYHPFTDAQSAGKRVWETEVSDLDANDSSISNGLDWAQNIHNGMVVAGMNAWHYWWGYEFTAYPYSKAAMDRA